ncbi:hypothetical protein V2J09_003053 [Rumex salicifolius]
MNCFQKFKKRDTANEFPLDLGINKGGSTVTTNKQQDLRVFSLVELKKATENFSPSSLIGRGGFSDVYRGAIKLHRKTENPTAVAIKRLKNNGRPRDDLALKERREVYLLGGVDHPNLVKLLGYCSVYEREGDRNLLKLLARCSGDGERRIHRFLVYEYMPNNSLDYHLFGNHLPALSWENRLQIMLGAAEGLAYLHEGLEVPIIHRNFKPSNVLLDMNFKAKVSGFALALEGPGWDESDVSTQVGGTMGYIDPAYIWSGHVSLKSDIYSYGVVLYEILTGRRVRDRLDFAEEFHLLEWVKQHPGEGRQLYLYRILDSRLQNNYSRSAAVSIAKLADRCISHEPEDRPSMREIINLLRDVVSNSDESSAGESPSAVSKGTAHSTPNYSFSDADVCCITAFKETVSEYDKCGEGSPTSLAENHQGESLPDLSKCQSPTPIETSAAEHLHLALPIDFENPDYNKKNNRLGQQVLDLDQEEVEAKKLLFLFGEGYEFEKQMIIQLWMALGLLSDEPMEVIGAYYFENLLSEGFIFCSVANSLYRVNFKKLGTELNINNQNYIQLDSGRRDISPGKTFHASVVCDEINASIFQTLGGFKRLRTLLFLGNFGSRLQQVPRDLFLCYESLEALDLSGTHIKELPSSAGKMINLRYLDLSWTFLDALPERIDRFKKLQTLRLEGCSRLRRLPNEMKGLTDLRHLHLDVLRELAAFPEGMGALENIRTLSGFLVGTEQGLKISELKNLKHITGSFCIAKIENVQSADEAKEASLATKRNIKKLKLRWSNHKIQHPINENESILQNLCPCSDLEEIQIVCYPGSKLPDWIADVSFHKLVSITLFGCVRVAMLPSLEKLHSLSSLELINLNSLTKLDFKGGADFIAFPKLEKLSLDGMLNLKTWEEAEEGDYPCLVELSIKNCPKLVQFPSVVYAPILKHLEVSGCTNLALVSDEMLSISLEQLIVEDCPLMEDRCCKDVGQDWHKIQHVPTIWINQVAIQSIEDMFPPQKKSIED